jgi:PAS domain-containing protein
MVAEAMSFEKQDGRSPGLMSRVEGPETNKEFEEKVHRLVGVLRERVRGGLREVLAPLLLERDRALAGQLAQGGAAILEYYDRLILTVLSMRYDALDAAVSETTFGIAEIDGEGLISYANEALQKAVPGALGHDFAALFGPRSRDVSEALSTGRRETLRLDLHRGNLPSVHLRGELGPLIDEHNRRGAYALLLGLDGEAARLDALPAAILQLDPENKIVFANVRAKEIFGDAGEQLRGRPAASLFSTDGSIGAPPIADWLRSADGHEKLAELERLDRRGATPVRLTVTPSFDTAESRAGTVLTITPIADELVRADLQELLSKPKCEPEDLVRGVMEAVKRIVPYDLATFGIYTEDLRYHYTLVVHPTPEWTWTTAWFPLGPQVRSFLLSERTWGSDVQETTKALNPEVENDEVFKNVVGSGMRGFTTLTITGGGEHIRASLTLLSKHVDCYDGREIDQMRGLGVEKALLVAEANILRRREDQIRRLEAKIARAYEYQGLVDALVHGIVDCFGWDYVAVFGVDRRDKLFRLIHQYGRPGFPTLDPRYTQPLDDGLLGASLRESAPLAEPDIEAASQHGYRPVVSGRRSAFAVPIGVVQQAARLTPDEVDWMFLVESGRRNAFQGPDLSSLKEALAQCEGILRQRWQKAVQTCLLNTVEQAMIFVDRAGKVRLTNRWANTLLSQGRPLFGEVLSNFGAEESDRRLLRSTNPVAQVRLMLRADEAVNVPTLATQRQVNDDHGHRLWLFTDLRERDSQINLGYLEQTVNEVAQNARIPLMLARSLVDSAKRLLRESGITDMLERAGRLLDKADITYERLASTLAIRQEPDSPRQSFDAVDVLQRAIADLPEEDIQNCDVTDIPSAQNAKSFMISGWPELLSFAFRSLLDYLLYRRPTDSKVRIALGDTSDGSLELLFSVPIGTLSEPTVLAKPTDHIGIAEQRAREVASLAPEAVELAVRRHNGEFQVDRRDSSVLAFRVELRPMP